MPTIADRVAQTAAAMFLEALVEPRFDTVPWELVVRAVKTVTDCPWVLLYVKRWLEAPLQHPDGTLVERSEGTPQGSAMTAPTQKVTWVIGACGGRDRVADRDRVVVASDQDFADDETQDALLFGDVELVQPVGEAAEEAFEGVGELEVGLGVVQLGVEASSWACSVLWRLRSVGIRARSSSSAISCSW